MIEIVIGTRASDRNSDNSDRNRIGTRASDRNSDRD